MAHGPRGELKARSAPAEREDWTMTSSARRGDVAEQALLAIGDTDRIAGPCGAAARRR
jgi:hypothetical protein